MVESVKRKSKVKSIFAEGLCFYKLFWIFFIGCILGVLIETLYCLFLGGKFEIRWGVIYGPFNPVYGFGMVIMTLVLKKFIKLKSVKMFFLSAFLGGFYEYLCNFFQELALGTVSWNYSGSILSFGGRTSISYSLCWGALGLAWIKYAYPKISSLIESFPLRFGKIITWVLSVFMFFNMFISSAAVWRYSSRNHGIKAKNRFEMFLDRNFNDDLICFAYPNMKIVEK